MKDEMKMPRSLDEMKEMEKKSGLTPIKDGMPGNKNPAEILTSVDNDVHGSIIRINLDRIGP